MIKEDSFHKEDRVKVVREVVGFTGKTATIERVEGGVLPYILKFDDGSKAPYGFSPVEL